MRVSGSDRELCIKLIRDSKLSLQGIANEVGVSLSYVKSLYQMRRDLEPFAHRHKKRSSLLSIDKLQELTPSRCPKCRGMVYMPCVHCALKERLASGLPIEDQPLKNHGAGGTPAYMPTPEEIEQGMAKFRSEKRKRGEVMFEYVKVGNTKTPNNEHGRGRLPYDSHS